MSLVEDVATYPARQVVSESDPRFQIAASRRILHREGLDSQVGGHVSLRVPGEDAFLVTPFQYFDETLPEHVSKVGFDLQVIEPGTLPASPGHQLPRLDLPTAREDVNCVIHTHAKNMSVLSTTDVPFGVYYDYASLCSTRSSLGRRPDPGALRGGRPDGQGARRPQALLMGHHGSLHVGDTPGARHHGGAAHGAVRGLPARGMAVGGKPLDRGHRGQLPPRLPQERVPRADVAANYRRLLRSDPDLFAVLRSS